MGEVTKEKCLMIVKNSRVASMSDDEAAIIGNKSMMVLTCWAHSNYFDATEVLSELYRMSNLKATTIADKMIVSSFVTAVFN